MASMNISLPGKMKEWVEEQVASGRFANASDYVRDLLRRDADRAKAITELQAEIDKGLASGISDKTPEEVFAEARRRGMKALEKRDGVPHHARGR